MFLFYLHLREMYEFRVTWDEMHTWKCAGLLVVVKSSWNPTFTEKVISKGKFGVTDLTYLIWTEVEWGGVRWTEVEWGELS